MGLDLPIRTARLTLRALTPSDLDDHFALYSNPLVVRYLYPSPLTRDEAVESLGRRCRVELPQEGEWLNLAVERDGEFLGEVGLSRVSLDHRGWEVGYVFAPSAAGHGYAAEATRAMVDLAFDELEAHRVTGHLDARNHRSAALLERLGLRREAHLRENEFVKGEWCDEVVYAVLADEWASARSASPRAGPR
ncbi:MAG: GNAT family N-acetyltransferase [Acidimicrobiales bacterium]